MMSVTSLVVFFVFGDEGRIVVIVVGEGLIDFDVVFGLRKHGLDLAGILLGIGFFQRGPTLPPRPVPARCWLRWRLPLARQRRRACAAEE